MPRLTYFLEYGCRAVRHRGGYKVHTLAIHVANNNNNTLYLERVARNS